MSRQWNQDGNLDSAGNDEGDLRFAKRLLASAAHYETTPGAQARVRAALREELPETLVRRRWRRLGFFLLQPAVVVAILIGATAMAGATLGRHAIARVLHLEPALIENPKALNAAPSIRRPSVHQSATASATGSATDEAAAPSVPLESGPEASLVVQAMNALRHDHDPARASALLDQYRSRYPEGALTEEALVLAIEAAADRHDDAAAAALGKRYLQRYPNGHFVSVARAAVR